MPNWVMNELTCILPDAESYNAFKEKADTKNFYNSFFPMPEILVDTQSPSVNIEKLLEEFTKETGLDANLHEIANSGHSWFAGIAQQALKNQQAFDATGYTNWYDWSCSNWGVKWDASNCVIGNDLPDFHTIIYTFDSPWGTPEQFVIELSKLYPNATFEMVSGSIENDNHYEFTCDNGKMEITCCYETFREAIENGKWGGWDEWSELLEESEEIDS